MSRQTAEFPLEMPPTAAALSASSPTSPATGTPGEGEGESSSAMPGNRLTFRNASKPFLIPLASLLALGIHYFLLNRGLNPSTHTFPAIVLALLISESSSPPSRHFVAGRRLALRLSPPQFWFWASGN